MLAALLSLALAAPSDPAADTLALVNQARAARGVPALRADPRLARAARGHSRDMVAHAYFEHTSPTRGNLPPAAGRRSPPRARSGHPYCAPPPPTPATLRAPVPRPGWMRTPPVGGIAGDWAWGTTKPSPPAGAAAAWLRSPPHRRIMLA